MKEIRVNVMEVDIAQGIRQDECRCPVARAASRASGREVRVRGVCNVRIDGLGVVVLPMVAQHFVRRFDFGDPVEPFSFDLTIPDGAP